MAKRKHGIRGAGSVYLRKDGRYGAEIKLDGKKRTFYGKTEKEAYEKMQQAVYEQKQGTLVTGPQQTVKQYLEYWLENVHKPSVRLITYFKRQGIVKNHLVPTLGHIKLRNLKPEHIEVLYAKMLKEEYQPSTIELVHRVLSNALNHAVRRGLLARNVCAVVSKPRVPEQDRNILTIEQARKLMEVAKGHRLEALLLVAVITGLRGGELGALKWQDINFDGRYLLVRHTVHRLPKVGFVEDEPKTKSSRRKIALPQLVLDALKQHKINQDTMKQKAGSKWKNLDLVFPNTVGNYQEVNYRNKMFLRFLKEAELPPMRFHDLRHSAATILLSQGVNAKIVQEILGHSNIKTTLGVYGHVLPGMQGDTMNKWDEWM
jgi:integrase